MTYIETLSPIAHAHVDDFILLRTPVLTGSRLQDVKAVENSLLKFGMLSPLRVKRQDNKLIILDGRKRLMALRRLAFDGRLPRSLCHVPYIEEGSAPAVETSSLVRSETLYRTLKLRHQQGMEVATLSQVFDLSRQTVRDILSLSRLAPPIRRAFFDREIDFEEVKTYAAIPSKLKQLVTFQTMDVCDDVPHAEAA